MRLSIIIPVFNEEKTIEEILRRIFIQDTGVWEKEIIVVDDGSEDNSKLKVKSFKSKYPDLKLLEHQTNLGKGAAIRTGLKASTGDAVLIQDADLEYNPADWPSLLKALENSETKTVYGSRELHPERHGYFHFVWGVRLLTSFTNLLYGSRLTDIYTCYKLLRREVLENLNLKSSGFEIEAEITCKILKAGIPIKEVPIRYIPRKFSEGKKIKIRDGIIGLWTILKNRF